MRCLLPVVLAALGAGAVGCGRSQAADPPAKPAPAATVANTVPEANLATITLSPKAEQRLGIAEGLATVERRKLPRRRTFPGEVVVIPGKTIVLPAPVAGVVRGSGTEPALPTPGTRVKAGQPLLTVTPIISADRSVLSPGERLNLVETQAALQLRLLEARLALAGAMVDADGQISQARARLEAADVAFKRADQLYRDKAGPLENVDTARGKVDVEKAALAAANSRRELLNKAAIEATRPAQVDAGEPKPVALTCPLDGFVRSADVVHGQTVPAGHRLIEIVADSTVWVRVPLYSAEEREVDLTRQAMAAAPDERPDVAGRPAEWVRGAPPAGSALAASVDVVFQVDNADGRFRPGQRAAVSLFLRGDVEAPSVPWSAVLFDVHGGSWVYENTAPQTFVRRRVSVKYVVGDRAVLDARGALAVGAKVVAVGAAELFGTEFYVNK